MRKTTFTAAVLATLALALVGCSQAGDSAEMPDSMSDSSMTETTAPDTGMEEPGDDETASRSGTFTSEGSEMASGTVTIEGDTLTLSDFSSDEGPDLHIYLTNGADGAAVEAGMRIDAVAFDQASQTFSLEGVDASQYTHVVINCDKAKVVFGAASLS